MPNQNNMFQFAPPQQIQAPGQTQQNTTAPEQPQNMQGMPSWNNMMASLPYMFPNMNMPTGPNTNIPMGNIPGMGGQNTGGWNPMGMGAPIQAPGGLAMGNGQPWMPIQPPYGLAPGAVNSFPGINAPQVAPTGDQLMQQLLAGGPGAPTIGQVQQAYHYAPQQTPGEFKVPMGPVEQALLASLQQGPQGYQTAPGQGETFLSQLLSNYNQQPGTQFMQQLAQGQIPTQTMNFFQQELGRQQANINENFRGARFGSDLASVLAREQGRAAANLGAQSEAQALGAQGQMFGQQQGLGNILANMQTQRQQQALQTYLQQMGMGLGLETGREGNAFNLMFQEFLRQQGLPPDLLNLANLGNIGPATGNSTTQGPIPNVGATGIGAGAGALAFLPLLMSMYGQGSGQIGGGGPNQTVVNQG